MIAPANLSSVVLDGEMARRLTTAGKKTDEWRDRRDELIREAARNGGTLREIAAAVGMSNPGVLRVIRRGELEVHHVTALSQGGDKDDADNTVFLTPEEHARRDRHEPGA
jgi:transposase-like protein